LVIIWGIKDSLIGFVDMEDDAAGEDGVDHARQPEILELRNYLHASVIGGRTMK
jgi:hypothetical protein